jgi:CelD/BcsL family acetyltransferase involved in cellulose biosynthesis
MGWTFEWLRSWDRVWAADNLRRWQALADRPDAHASPFATPALARVWVEAMGGEARVSPCFLWARHASGQEAAWPLVALRGGWRQGFVRLMIPVGAAARPILPGMTLFDYQDPVAAPVAEGASVLADGFWPALLAELRGRQGDWFDRCAFPKVRAACFQPGAGAVPGDTAPFVDLAPYGDLEAFLMARKPRLRTNIRRSFRLLEAVGPVEFRMHGTDEIETILGWLPALEAARAERYPGSAMPAGFLRGVIVEGMAAGLLACSSLSVAGRAVSWDVGFLKGGVYYGYVRSFDTEFAQASPGMAHLARIVEWMIAGGGSRLDFLLGDEKYKAGWTDGEAASVAGLALRSAATASAARFALARAARTLGARPAERKTRPRGGASV